MSTYYIGQGSERKGPFTFEELRDRAIAPGTLVWREGMLDWQAASTMPELAALFGVPATPPPAPYAGAAGPYPGVPGATAQEINSKKILAGVFGIVMGGLGIHKFILGFTTAGVIMVCVSVLGACFTAGISAMAMSVIGIIEGVIYLTKSDAEFYQMYIVQKKEWF